MRALKREDAKALALAKGGRLELEDETFNDAGDKADAPTRAAAPLKGMQGGLEDAIADVMRGVVDRARRVAGSTRAAIVKEAQDAVAAAGKVSVEEIRKAGEAARAAEINALESALAVATGKSRSIIQQIEAQVGEAAKEAAAAVIERHTAEVRAAIGAIQAAPEAEEELELPLANLKATVERRFGKIVKIIASAGGAVYSLDVQYDRFGNATGINLNQLPEGQDHDQ